MRTDEFTGMLSAQFAQRAPEPLSIFKPLEISDEHWALMCADTNFMQWLATQPVFVRLEQISDRAARMQATGRLRAEEPERLRKEAEAKAARDRREAQVAPFRDPESLCDLVLSLEQRLASAEAELIQLKVRIAEIESRQPKPSLISRIRKSSTTPPEAA